MPVAAFSEHRAVGAAPELEGSVCPVHGEPAEARCDRCNRFLCAACETLGDPALCEACVEHEMAAMPRSEWKEATGKSIAYIFLGIFGGMLLLLLVAIVIHLLRG